MNRAIRFHETGGPEILKWEEVETPEPGEGEVLIRHTAIGLNYIDTYFRTGLYKTAMPTIPGMEAAGVVEKLGPGTTFAQVGDRVAYAGGPLGSYAEKRVIPEKFIVTLPDEIPDAVAAAIMVKGLTARFLVRHTFRVDEKCAVLVHAAAGGVGLLLCQWASALGAKVIGTVGSPEKAEMAKAAGCAHTINYREEDVAARVREITEGRGVNAVYDSVGKDTFMGSLDCLMELGLMVSYGQASGPIPPFDIGILRDKGSLFLTRPTLMTYIKDTGEYLAGCAEMFDMLLKGKLSIKVGQTYYLQDAARAHADLESRRTTGSTVLLVG